MKVEYVHTDVGNCRVMYRVMKEGFDYWTYFCFQGGDGFEIYVCRQPELEPDYPCATSVLQFVEQIPFPPSSGFEIDHKLVDFLVERTKEKAEVKRSLSAI